MRHTTEELLLTRYAQKVLTRLDKVADMVKRHQSGR